MFDNGRNRTLRSGYLTHTWKGSEAWRVNGQENGEGQGEAAPGRENQLVKTKDEEGAWSFDTGGSDLTLF